MFRCYLCLPCEFLVLLGLRNRESRKFPQKIERQEHHHQRERIAGRSDHGSESHESDDGMAAVGGQLPGVIGGDLLIPQKVTI